MSKKCTPLWPEAHFEVKMCKTRQVRTTFGSWDVEKVHAVVARSTFRSQNVQNTTCSDHSWKLRCRNSARRCGAKQSMRSTFRSQNVKTPSARTLFDVQISFCVAGTRDYAPCQTLAKPEGFVASPKTMAGVGHLKRICKEAFSVAGAVQETCSSELLGGAGDGFLRGCILEHQIFRLAEMILCDRRNTPGITFSWQAQYFRQVEWKNRKTHWYEAVSSALNFPFLKEVSQNCFVFDIVNFKKWGRLAELLRFWCCQLQKMEKSRRIASFMTLSS